MIELFTKKKEEEEGFTLIELLIVIVILGILAAIVVFAVGGTGQNSAVAACKSDARSLETALEAYKAQNNGNYPGPPTSPTDTTTAGTGWGALLNVGGGGTGTPYLRSAPSTAHYLVWWDNTGAVFAAGPGNAYPAATSAENFDTSGGAACNAAS